MIETPKRRVAVRRQGTPDSYKGQLKRGIGVVGKAIRYRTDDSPDLDFCTHGNLIRPQGLEVLCRKCAEEAGFAGLVPCPGCGEIVPEGWFRPSGTPIYCHGTIGEAIWICRPGPSEEPTQTRVVCDHGNLEDPDDPCEECEAETQAESSEEVSGKELLASAMENGEGLTEKLVAALGGQPEPLTEEELPGVLIAFMAGDFEDESPELKEMQRRLQITFDTQQTVIHDLQDNLIRYEGSCAYCGEPVHEDDLETYATHKSCEEAEKEMMEKEGPMNCLPKDESPLSQEELERCLSRLAQGVITDNVKRLPATIHSLQEKLKQKAWGMDCPSGGLRNHCIHFDKGHACCWCRSEGMQKIVEETKRIAGPPIEGHWVEGPTFLAMKERAETAEEALKVAGEKADRYRVAWELQRKERGKVIAELEIAEEKNRALEGKLGAVERNDPAVSKEEVVGLLELVAEDNESDPPEFDPTREVHPTGAVLIKTLTDELRDYKLAAGAEAKEVDRLTTEIEKWQLACGPDDGVHDPSDMTPAMLEKMLDDLTTERDGLREAIQEALGTSGQYDKMRPPRNWIVILQAALVESPAGKGE